jgi:hypothetical protein
LQTQVTSTKNPFYALSFDYEDTFIRKGKRSFGLNIPRKRMVFQKSDLRIEFVDNRIEQRKAQACSASSLGKVFDYICSFEGKKRR